MKGSVFRRKGSKVWTFKVDVGRDETGKRITKWQGGFRTRKEAQDALDHFKGVVARGGDPFPEKLTLNEFSRRWLEHQRSRIRPSTHERYAELLKMYVLPELGTLQLEKIRPAHVQRTLDLMGEKGLSARTVTQARAVLSSALRRATAWGLIQVNPVAAVSPPKAAKPELKIPTPQQIHAVIEAAAGTAYGVAILLAGTTGARRGEVLGLKWEDIDLSTGSIVIDKALQHDRARTFALVPPKTARGYRRVVIPAPYLPRLRRHRQEQLERRMKLGPGWNELEGLEDLVCERGDGHPITPAEVTKAFKRIATKVGLHPSTRLHDLRHGVATALGREGVRTIDVSAVLGHASPGFTMATYQHVWEAAPDEAAVALGAALSRGGNE